MIGRSHNLSSSQPSLSLPSETLAYLAISRHPLSVCLTIDQYFQPRGRPGVAARCERVARFDEFGALIASVSGFGIGVIEELARRARSPAEISAAASSSRATKRSRPGEMPPHAPTSSATASVPSPWSQNADDRLKSSCRGRRSVRNSRSRRELHTLGDTRTNLVSLAIVLAARKLELQCHVGGIDFAQNARDDRSLPSCALGAVGRGVVGVTCISFGCDTVSNTKQCARFTAPCCCAREKMPSDRVFAQRNAVGQVPK
jgi:hypothetical protein